MRSLAAVVAIGIAAGICAPHAVALAPGEVTNLMAVPGTSTPLQSTANDASLASTPGRSVSADGRYVVFESSADHLSSSDDDGVVNVYRRDTQDGVTRLVSRADGLAGAGADKRAFDATISNDGDRVAFMTAAKLVPEDTNGVTDVYVRIISTGVTRLASRATGADGAIATTGGGVSEAEISGNGRWVAFITAAPLDPADANGADDAYVRQVDGDAVTIAASRDETAGDAIAGARTVAISDGTDSGAVVAFVSSAALTADESDGLTDVFAREVAAAAPADGTTELVSRATGAGGADSNGLADDPSVSGDGETVAFMSLATNLGADSGINVYARDRATQTTTVVRQCAGQCRDPQVGEDGGTPVVTFTSNEGEFAGLSLPAVVVQRRLPGGPTVVVSRGTGLAGVVDEGGRFGAPRHGDEVAFTSSADPLSADDIDPFSDVFLRRPSLQQTVLVSRPSGTAPLTPGAGPAFPAPARTNGARVFSADGRYVVFIARAAGLVPAGFGAYAGSSQAYRRDLRTGELLLVSRAGGVAAQRGVGQAAISADGRYVAFSALGDDLASAFGAASDSHVYRHDTATGQTILVSREDGTAGAPASSGAGMSISMSADGDVIAFESDSPGLAAGQVPGDHVFVRTLSAGRTELVSRGPGGTVLGGGSFDPALSADGRVVAFVSDNDGLDGILTLDPLQVLAHDRVSGQTVVVSRPPGGAIGNGASESPDISGDGNLVVFVTEATGLDPADGDAGRTVVLADRTAGTRAAVSRAGGTIDQGALEAPYISGDGRHVLWSSAQALDAGDTDADPDVYVRDTALGTTALVGRGTGAAPLGSAFAHGVSTDARCVMFRTDDGAIQPGSPTSRDFELPAVRAVTADCPVPPPAPPASPADPVTPPPPAPADTAAPALTGVSLSAKRFRVRGARLPAGRGRPAPAGTTMRLTLSEAATVRVLFERRAAGKRVNRRCLAPTRSRAKRPNCIRFIAAGALTRPTLAAGARRIPITGKVGRRALRPGAYRLSVTAIDAAGNRSAVRRVNFTIVRR